MSKGFGGSSDISSMSMHDLYRMEAENHTSTLAKGLLDLEKNFHAADKLEELMRASHSVKGAARIVGMEAVVEVSHLLEDCFVKAQRSELTLQIEHVDLMLKAVDAIVNISHLNEPDVNRWVSENSKLLKHIKDQMQNLVSGKPVTVDAPGDSKSTAKKSASAKSSTKKSTTTAVKPSKQKGEQVLNANTDSFPAASSNIVNSNETLAESKEERVVRVNADRLTRIMGISSEILIESGWLRPFTDSMLLLKRRQAEITNLLESIKDSIERNSGPEATQTQLVEAQKKLSECRNLLSERLVELDDYDRRNLNLSSKMYNEVVASRMRPFADGTLDLQRMVRDIARKLKKKVDFTIEGQDTPVDRDILEKVKAPLIHLVRNSIDHGIETPAVREKRGKTAEGKITLSASHGGGMLTITIEDDGNGVDLENLRKKIVTRGLVTKEFIGSLSEAELLDFLFLPDFTTKSKVTEYSGRGVGLDVVRSLVQEMHGKVWVVNEEGKGLKFVLQLPLTLSVITALVVDIADEAYAFPLSRVDRLLTVLPEDVNLIEGRQYITLDGEHVGLISASRVLELDRHISEFEEFYVVVVSDRLSRYGVVVDRFIGQRELSVQSIDVRLGKVQDVSSAALLEDGSPVLVLDVDDMVRSIDSVANGGRIGTVKVYQDVLSHKLRKRVLVVDDSLTVRELERKLLENNGYRVDVAVDGMDGWNAVRRTKYSLVITDVDMPRMDGIELVSSMKQDHHLKSLPIMIVSYKDRQEDRQRGLEAGADYYLTKGSFHDETLIEAVVDLIGESTE